MLSDPRPLNDLLTGHARNRGDRTFIVHRNGSYSYAQSWHLAECFASYLSAIGITKGDSIGIALPRRPEYLFAFLGATRIGALPFGINYLLPIEQNLVFLRAVRPKVVVAAGPMLEVARQANESLQVAMTIVDIDGQGRGCQSWEEIASLRPEPIAHCPLPEDVAYLNFTTGTSGAAKGALATHANIHWNTRAAVETFGLGEQDVHMVMFASFAHPHELFSRALMTGGSLVLLEEINPKTIANTIARHGVTCMMGLAPMYAMMGEYCERAGFESLRIAESGGMYTSPAINERFRETTGVPILSVWGSTETTGIALANTLARHKTDGSMGKVCPFYEVKVVDGAGQSVPNGRIGELWIRGPAVVSGYQGESSLTDGSRRLSPIRDAEGWYHSGDLAWQDDDGFFHFVERISGLIKVAGLKVYPLQVEITLLEHPCIKEAAVIEARDARRGAVPAAFIVRDSETVTETDILAWCRQRMSAYMVPKKIFILESLPKIGSGKINKRQLRHSHAADLQLSSVGGSKTP